MPLVERHHPFEDPPVRIAVEITGVDDLRGVIERLVVDEDRAQHGTLGVEIVRKRTLRERDEISHGVVRVNEE
ncbi:hypothetical protein D3C83_204260 [compost metagenome]